MSQIIEENIDKLKFTGGADADGHILELGADRFLGRLIFPIPITLGITSKNSRS
jgi:hypothetical protein